MSLSSIPSKNRPRLSNGMGSDVSSFGVSPRIELKALTRLV